MNKQRTVQTKVNPDGDWVALGRSFADTPTMDGGALPETMEFDMRSGRVRWRPSTPIAQRDNELHEFSFTHFVAVEVRIEADKAQIAADGVEQVTLAITCEDTAETEVVLAVYHNGEKLGTLEAAIRGGAGSKPVTIGVAGTYEYKADLDTLDATWGVGKFRDAGGTMVKVV